MANSGRGLFKNIDITLVVCYLLLISIGWISIYASVYSEEATNLLSLSARSGSQLIWIGIGITLASSIIFLFNPKLYTGFVWWYYILVILLLVAVLFFGKTVNGSKSWLVIGPFSFQPSEVSKITTSLAIASVMSQYGFRLTNIRCFSKVCLIFLFPIALIFAEPDMGTILVYCGFIFVLYREGLSGWIVAFLGFCVLLFILTLKFSPFISILVAIGILGIVHGFLSRQFITSILGFGAFITAAAFLPRLLQLDFLSELNKIAIQYWLVIATIPFLIRFVVIGIQKKRHYYLYLFLCYLFAIGLIMSEEIIFNDVLQAHHRDRIENLLGITEDLQGAGYNVNQSKIAIGSGGFTGKGFLQGTQTKFKFVPEQSTDFIFCTIGEEWGFLGSIVVVILYFVLIFRIITLAERQKDAFVRIYGYCVAACFFMHVFINIGMTIGLMPVVGIPLPFISYGGSSFLSFTILLFIFIRMDIERWR